MRTADPGPYRGPYRGRFGAPRPAALADLALPPAAMPPRRGSRPLQAWRYVAVLADELIACAAEVRVGPARQAFWAVWDRRGRRLTERRRPGRGGRLLTLETGRLHLRGGGVELELGWAEGDGVECVSPAGADGYGWTRKQAGLAARGRVRLDRRAGAVGLDATVIIDDTAAYYPRHTTWWWSAGAGTLTDGRPVAWNLVAGVGDPEYGSERTVWVAGVPREMGPARFADDLRRVTTADGADLGFAPEVEREHGENLLVVRSRLRQPFGTFTGRLGVGLELARAAGVMEHHDVWW